MRQITPHLWFNAQAREAVAFYVSVFDGARVNQHSVLHGVPTPTGDCDVLWFELSGQPFIAIDGGPQFTINPSVSFILNFDPSQDTRARQRLDAMWDNIAEGGQPLMPLDRYPFNDRYGWVQDRYGVSWQFILSNPTGDPRPFITPSLLFTGDVCGKAEEATDFYMSLFGDARRGLMARYPAGMAPEQEGTVMFTDFMINGQWFAAMDSARAHDFGFNEAVSLVVPCDSQKEIDYYWDSLSTDPTAEQCGWLKDRHGLSWQISPARMEEMMRTGTPAQTERLTKAFLPMKKIDLAALEAAFDGA